MISFPRKALASLGSGIAAGIVLSLAPASAGLGQYPEVPVAPELLQEQFQNPPKERRLRAWWFWVPPYLTKEGIHKDIAAMDAAGMGGAHMITHPPAAGVPKGFEKSDKGIPLRSPGFYSLIGDVLDDMAERGMFFDTHNCHFYHGAGGPWVKPEDGMRVIRLEHWMVKGPEKLSAPWPAAPTGKEVWKSEGEWKKSWDAGVGINIPGIPNAKRETYRDIVLMAVPGRITPPNQARINGDLFMHRQYAPASNLIASAGTVTPDNVRILNGSLANDGTVTWDVPEGEWTLLRFMSEPQNFSGNEVDKWDRALFLDTVDRHIGPAIKEGQEHLGKTFQYLTQDSYESGVQTWSANMVEVFKKRRGYDPLPWMPALAGVAVGSREESERFIWDLRRTMADQTIYEGMNSLLKEYANRHNLGFAQEGRPLPLHNLTEWWSIPEKPMDEAWFDANWKSRLKLSKEMVAAVADYYGRPVVGLEGFTDLGSIFRDHPGNMKPLGDSFLASGFNQIIPHCYTAQPFDEKPGYRLYGSFVNRSSTWWEQARPYFLTIGRIQTLLQQMRGVSDILLVEDESPNGPANTKALEDTLPKNNRFDACSAYELQRLTVRDGKIVSPIGKTYSVLYYFCSPRPASQPGGRIRPEILRELARLSEAGATLVSNSPRPTGSPSLKDYPASNQAVEALAKQLWDGGKIHPPAKLASLLTPDIQDHGKLNWTHRRTDRMEAYFLANHETEPVAHTVSFRVSGLVPELWHPETGQTEPIAVWREENGRTLVPLRFEPTESYFVIFRKYDAASATPHWVKVEGAANGQVRIRDGRPVLIAAEAGEWKLTDHAGKQQTIRSEAPPASIRVGGPWTVSYPAGQNTPASLTLPVLQNMRLHDNRYVQGFSGTATWKTEFDVPAELLAPELELTLDLGQVEQLAAVKINGRDVGIAWRLPYRLILPAGILKPGKNFLEVDVTNTWLNRMVMQNDLPEAERIGDPTSWLSQDKIEKMKGYADIAKQGYLMDSGLIGPVHVGTKNIVLINE